MNEIFNKLVKKAYDRVAYFNTPGGKIGSWITDLSNEEREELKTLTTEDTNHRIPSWHGMKPIYPWWNKDYKE